MYSSYDDGTLLVVKYKTPEGVTKLFSIGNGNIDNCGKDCPESCKQFHQYRLAPGAFLFDDEKTKAIMKPYESTEDTEDTEDVGVESLPPMRFTRTTREGRERYLFTYGDTSFYISDSTSSFCPKDTWQKLCMGEKLDAVDLTDFFGVDSNGTTVTFHLYNFVEEYGMTFAVPLKACKHALSQAFRAIYGVDLVTSTE